MKRFLVLLAPALLFLFLLSGCDETECVHGAMEESTVAPTCDKEGYTLHQCAECDFQYKTDLLPPTSHAMTPTVTAPTCASEGFTTYTCACGYTYVSDRVEPVGHTLQKEVHAPTCTAEGYTVYSCACGYTYKGSILAPTGHTYQTLTVAPSCEKEGYTLHTCSACAHSYRSSILSALGHDLSAVAVAPTCVAEGYTLYTCSRGDLSYKADYQAELGHQLKTVSISHPTVTDSGQLTQKCTECDHQFTGYLLYADFYSDAYVSGTAPLAKGIDVSKFQHYVNGALNPDLHLNWATIKSAGIDFAILRAGYIGTKDPVFEMNYADARAAGMDLGVYYYTYAKTAEEAVEEAEELIGWLEGKRFEYPVYYDIEDSSLQSLGKTLATEVCMAFVNTMREAGYYAAVYANENWLSNFLDAQTLKSYCELWYARYQRDPDTNSSEFDSFTIPTNDDNFTWLAKYGGQVGLWQYTQCGVIEGSGIGGKVDLNYAFKDYPAMMKKYCFNGFTAA